MPLEIVATPATNEKPTRTSPHPTMSDEILAHILTQLMDQLATGPPPDIEEFVRQHPGFEQNIREMWATIMVLQHAAPSSPEEEGTFLAPSLHGSNTNAPPPSLSNYELDTELGRGGMGVVYRARQKSPRRTVAVKLLLGGDHASAQHQARFRSEAESVAKLDHPHIVKVFEVGENDGQPYFSMQYIPGTTLAQRIAQGPLPSREAAQLLIPVCRAIDYANQQGLLHRDLKPSNILLDEHGHPFVTDFGLAKQVRTQDSVAPHSLTHSGAIVGTPGYMAPEQAIGERGQLSPATDVYSLGAVLYAMLTGRAPFQAASPIDAILMILEQDPPLPRLLNPAIDPDLEMILLKALQKPADLRYQSAGALADDLNAYLNHEPISARSSQFSQVLSRAFRPTHHIGVLENWGLLWMWHAVVLLVLCIVTDVIHAQGTTARWPYLLVWVIGLGAWAAIFWNLRRRAGPVTFVERQIAHVWAASMASSSALYGVEALLKLPPLTLSPVLGLIAGSVFLAKAGILSGEFYLHAVVLFLTAIPMALFPSFALTIFGVVSALAFFLSGLKFHQLKKLSARPHLSR
ncbi:MAG: serine/threonine protein kinase [Planctomycetaceae bacterium]|nr:serine/threonine protein kinase [Planctomycetaceae bacterium]